MESLSSSAVIVNDEQLIELLKEQIAYNLLWNKWSEFGIDIPHDVAVVDWIWDILGFPKDESLNGEGYCRDWLHEMWHEFMDQPKPDFEGYLSKLKQFADESHSTDN